MPEENKNQTAIPFSGYKRILESFEKADEEKKGNIEQAIRELEQVVEKIKSQREILGNPDLVTFEVFKKARTEHAVLIDDYRARKQKIFNDLGNIRDKEFAGLVNEHIGRLKAIVES